MMMLNLSDAVVHVAGPVPSTLGAGAVTSDGLKARTKNTY